MFTIKTLRTLSLPLALCAAHTSAGAQPNTVVGEWRGIAGPEHLIFRSNGLVRTCFGPNTKGNAAMGGWTELSPGRYRITFTHAISPNCDTTPQVIRKYQVEILGLATVSPKATELALFVSGEGPPDRYARVGASAAANSSLSSTLAASTGATLK